MKWYIIVLIVVLVILAVLITLYLMSGRAGNFFVSYKECGTNSECITDAIYACEPAKGISGDVQVTVKGTIKAQSTFAGENIGVIEFCEVNFKEPSGETTCALPSMYLTQAYSVYEYMSFDKYCAPGGNPPSSTS